MNDFQDKPKRKNQARNPYLFLGAGVGIGMLVTGLLVIVFFYVGRQDAASSLEPFNPTEVPMFPPTAAPTQAPIFGQEVQPTVIAARVQAAAVSADGRYLATVDVEEGESVITLHQLNVERSLSGERTELYRIGGYFDEVVFSPDSSRLVAAINGGIAILFDVETRSILEEYPNIGGAAFNHDGSRLALVGAPNGIRLIDTENLSLVASTQHEAYQVGAVAISNQNKLALALDGSVHIYDLDNLDVSPQIYAVSLGFVGDLAFHPSGDYLAMSGDSIVQVLELKNQAITQYNVGTQRIHALAFSANGEWLAIGGGESGYGEAQLFVFRWADSEFLPPDPAYYNPVRLVGHEHSIFDVAFTSDGYLVSASWDGSVRLWDLETRQEISRLQM